MGDVVIELNVRVPEVVFPIVHLGEFKAELETQRVYRLEDAITISKLIFEKLSHSVHREHPYPPY